MKAFFVEEESRGQRSQKSNEELARIDIELLALGKRTGLSFAEMNELTAQELLDYVKAYTGTKDNKPRMATQEDIDAFYRGVR